MTQKNEISIEIPQAELAKINDLATQLKAAIAPYIIGLTKKEIAGIFKMGDKTVAFVSKVKDYSTTNPEFVPNFMSVVDFIVDVDAVNALSPVSKSIKQINTDIDDTLMLCGSEALTAALMYYRNVKFNADQGVASAKPIYEDLKKRFPGKSKKQTPPPTTPEV
jgi:hypothetical protein